MTKTVTIILFVAKDKESESKSEVKLDYNRPEGYARHSSEESSNSEIL